MRQSMFIVLIFAFIITSCQNSKFYEIKCIAKISPKNPKQLLVSIELPKDSKITEVKTELKKSGQIALLNYRAVDFIEKKQAEKITKFEKIETIYPTIFNEAVKSKPRKKTVKIFNKNFQVSDLNTNLKQTTPGGNPIHIKNDFTNNELTIYFRFETQEVSGDYLHKNDVKDVNDFANSINPLALKQIKIIGATDSNGNPNYNKDLAQRRAKSIAKILKKHLKGVKITIHTEKIKSGDDFTARQKSRRAKIVPIFKSNQETTETVQENVIKTNYALIDVSTNMGEAVNGNDAWDYVNSLKFAPKTKVFAFAKNADIIPPVNISDPKYTLTGKNSFFSSLYKFLRITNDDSITVISSGTESARPYTAEEVVSMALSKGARINIIMFNVEPDKKFGVKMLCEKTNGKCEFK